MQLPLRTLVVPFTLACLPVHGCTQVDKGAVEVSWSLYTDSGSTTQCEESGLENIVLQWTVVGDDDHESRRNHAFQCDDRHGVTGFEVTEGTASLWLALTCIGGATPDALMYEAPPPIVRSITAGDVVTLETQLIQVAAGACP
jgi:hypothetical protein